MYSGNKYGYLNVCAFYSDLIHIFYRNYYINFVELCIMNMQTSESISFDIIVHPNRNKDEIDGYNKWRNRFEISISEKAQDGKANKEIINFFSELFMIDSGDIKITKGKKSHLKTISIKTANKEEILKKLSVYK